MGAFVRLLDVSKTIVNMAQMHWRILDVPPDTFPLLTSDRAVIRTNGMPKGLGHLVLPIGPRRLFVAAPELDTVEKLQRFSRHRLAQESNQQVVEFAVTYVFGTDDTQRRFVQNRMAKLKQPRLMETVGRERPPEEWGEPPSVEMLDRLRERE